MLNTFTMNAGNVVEKEMIDCLGERRKLSIYISKEKSLTHNSPRSSDIVPENKRVISIPLSSTAIPSVVHEAKALRASRRARPGGYKAEVP